MATTAKLKSKNSSVMTNLAVSARKGVQAILSKSSANQVRAERFENISKNEDEETEAESPVGDLNQTVQKMRQNFTHSTFRFRNRADHIFIALSLVVSIHNVLRFPVICFEGGGVLFLIPYVICLTIITTPIIFLENALGQYSSLPPLQLFYHLCPAFGGFGFAMTLVAIFKCTMLTYTSLDVFFSLKSLTAAFSSWSKTAWLECVYDGHPNCYDPYVQCNEAGGSYQYYSKCYELRLQNNAINPNFTWEQVVIGMTSTSKALREFPPDIYLMEKIRKPGKPSVFFMASATVQQAVIAIIAMLGIRIYAKIARFVVVFPNVCMISCIIFAFVKDGFQDTFASIAEGFSPNVQKFFSFKTWGAAMLHAIVSTNMVDGSFITLAAMKDFRNNFMRDTLVVIIFGIITNILSCFVVFSICGAVSKLIYPMHNHGTRLAMLWNHGEKVHFSTLPLFFAKTSIGAIILSFTYFSTFLCTVGSQILALEMIIMTVYRAAARLKYIDRTTSRNIIICLYFLFMHLYSYINSRYIFKDERLRYFYFAFVLSILAFFELLVSIHIYRLKRFIVNLRTMLGAPPSDFWKYLGYPVNWYWTVCWYIVTPFVCLSTGTLILLATIHSGLFRETTISGTMITLFPLSIIFVIMVIQLIRAYRTGTAVKLLFVADLRWAPELGADRSQALYEERAARAFI